MFERTNWLLNKIKATSRDAETIRFCEQKPGVKSQKFLSIPKEKKIEAIKEVKKHPKVIELDLSDIPLGQVESGERKEMFGTINYFQIQRLNLSNTQYHYGIFEQPSSKNGSFSCVKSWEPTMRDFYSNIRVKELIVTEFDNYLFLCSSLTSLTADYNHSDLLMNINDKVFPSGLCSLTLKNPSSMRMGVDWLIKGMARQGERLPSLTYLSLTIPSLPEEKYIALLRAVPRSLLTLNIKIEGKISTAEGEFHMRFEGEPYFPPVCEGESKMLFPLTKIPVDTYNEILPPRLNSFITDDPASHEILDAVKHMRTISTALTALPKSATDTIVSYARENPSKFWKEKPADLELQSEQKKPDKDDLEDEYTPFFSCPIL